MKKTKSSLSLQSVLSRSRCSLSKTSGASVSLSLSAQQRRPPTPANLHLHVSTIILLSSPSVQSPYPTRKQRQQTVTATPTAPLPSQFPATTGIHFRRHNDQKNHLEVLYTKVLTFSPFNILEKSRMHCSSSSFYVKNRLLLGTVTGPGRAQSPTRKRKSTGLKPVRPAQTK